MTVIGTAEVRILADGRGFGPSLQQQVEKPAKDVFSRLGALAAGAFAVSKGVEFFRDLAESASDAAETASKVEVVFGDASDTVVAFGEDAAESVGLSSQAAQEAAGTFGNLFRAIQIGEADAATMSTTLIQLAGDLASFNNADPTDVLEALRSGLVGETEPLRRFGINLNDAALRQEALNLGLDTSGTTLSAAVKAQAAYSAILSQTTLAQGDFERTSGGLANQQRILSAEWADAKVELGQGLAPVMLQLVQIGRDELLPAVLELGQNAAPLLGSAFGAAAPLIGTTTDLLVALTPAISAVVSVIDAIPEPVLQLAAVAATATAGVDRTVGAVSRLAERATSLSTVVHATPVPYANWEPTSQKASGGLRNLTTGVQGVGAAIGLGVTAFSLYSAAMEDMAAEAEAFGQTVRDNFTEGITAATEPMAFLTDNVADIDAAIADLDRTIDGSSAPWDADFRHELALGREELEAQRGTVRALQDTFERLGAVYGITADEAARFAVDAGIDLAQGAGAVEDAFYAEKRAALDAAGAIGDVGDASNDTTDELDAQREALEKLTDATLDAFDSQLDYADSLADTDSALADVQTAYDGIHDGVGTAAEDQAALEQALRDAERAAVDQAQAALDMADAAAIAAGETLSWQDKNTILITELYNVAATLDPSSPLRARLVELIGELDSVPGTYEATVAVDTTNALTALSDLEGRARILADLLVGLTGEGRSNPEIPQNSSNLFGSGSGASGFRGTISRPTRFLVGEGGQPEDVLVVPHSAGGMESVFAGVRGASSSSGGGVPPELVGALQALADQGPPLVVQGATVAGAQATAVAVMRKQRADSYRRNGR